MNERGLFNSNLQTAAAEQAMIDAAECVMGVIDSTKFGHHALAHVCTLDRINYLVADDELSTEWQQRTVAAGMKLTLAPRMAETPDASTHSPHLS